MIRQSTLVIGATGKTGRRVAERLRARNLPIERALGRPARDFADYVRETVATAVWNAGSHQ